jgi:RimJ/RimL family protein N-acetyltransferase
LYIRNRVPKKDDPYLIEMVMDNFKVKKETIKSLLKYSNEVLIVCDDDDRIAGFVSYRFRIHDMVYVDYVVLDYKYQGKGIATSFLPVFEKHMLDKGIRTIYGTVDEENEEALRLFLRWGFEVKGQIASSVIIEKHLKKEEIAPSPVAPSPVLKRGQAAAKPNVKKIHPPPPVIARK